MPLSLSSLSEICLPFLVNNLLQFPGPNEAGLAFLRDRMEMFPKTQVMWRGPSYPILLLKHPDVIGNLLQTSGMLCAL